MKRFILFLASVLFLLSATPEPVQAQTAEEPNSGFKFERDHVNSIWRIKWWAKSGRTYFLQHTEDLQQWFWFPIVAAGDDSIKEWGFTSNATKSFFRLIHTEAPTDDPEGGDFDGDGASNLAEVQQGSDPLNYYSQGGTIITPVLSIVSGNNQALSPGVFSGPLTVKVTNGISGPTLLNAPVTFSVAGGSEVLAQSPTEVAEFFSTLTLRTDPLTGEISNFQDKVHVRLPAAPSSLDQINAVAAGSLSGFVGLPVQFTVYNYNPFVPPVAPTNLMITANGDGSLTYTWQDNSDSETGFTVEYQLSDGSWASLGSVGPNVTSLTVSAVTVVGLGLTPASNTRDLAINGAGPSGSGDSEPKLRTWRASFEFHLDDDYGATYIFLANSLATLRDEWQLYQPAAYVAAHDAFVNDLPNLDYGPSSGGPGWAEAVSLGSFLAADVFTYRHYGELSPYHGCQDTSGTWRAFQVATSQPVETAYSASYIILKNKSAEFEEPNFEALGTARFDIPVGKTLANLTLEGMEESGDIHGDEHTLYLEPEPKYNLNNYNEWTSRNGYWLLPIDISFEKVGDNWEIEDNKDADGKWMPGKGKRMFVDAKTPTETGMRDSVYVKVKNLPPGWKVHLKAFDVDDPTTDELDPNHVIDSNDTATVKKGDDNRAYSIFGIMPPIFDSSSNDTVDCTANSEGIAELASGELPKLKMTDFAGDNVRVAVIFLKSDGTPMSGQDLSGLQVTNSTQPGYVSGDSEKPARGFSGGLSPMLTVWRKLNIEIDSMEAVAITGPERNLKEGTVLAVIASSGQSTVTVNIALNTTNQYENGYLTVGETSYQVVSNTNDSPILGIGAEIVIKGVVPNSALNQAFTITDDDDHFYSHLELPSALPRSQTHVDLIRGIQRVYTPAYIQLEDANALNLNPRITVPFKLNEVEDSALGSVFNNAKDLTDTESFWAATLVFGYQPDSPVDHDPVTESLRNGGTSKVALTGVSHGFSVVYIESIREGSVTYLEYMAQAVFNLPNTKKIAREAFLNLLYGVIAHEIGHHPGGNRLENSDHSEEGLMQEGGATILTDFEASTIIVFETQASGLIRNEEKPDSFCCIGKISWKHGLF